MMKGLVTAETAAKVSANARKEKIKNLIEARSFGGHRMVEMQFQLNNREEAELRSLGYTLDHRSINSNAQVIRW